MKIVIINYDMGNLRSVQKAFERVGASAMISDDPKIIEDADKLVLPGVGHFGLGMQKLHSKRIIDILHHKVSGLKTPILGICLGMQLLTRYSEEGNADGLGWIDAETLHLDLGGHPLKVPHMGWNTVEKRKDSKALEGISPNDMFYFVHSYSVKCKDENDVLLKTTYGSTFHSAVEKENIVGFQFHPEKSHKSGLLLIKNFIEKF